MGGKWRESCKFFNVGLPVTLRKANGTIRGDTEHGYILKKKVELKGVLAKPKMVQKEYTDLKTYYTSICVIFS